MMPKRPETAGVVGSGELPRQPRPGVRVLCRVTGSRTVEEICVNLALGGGSVLFVRDVTVPQQLPLSMWGEDGGEEGRVSRELEVLVDRARAFGVDAEPVLRVGHDAARTLRGASEAHAAGVIVLEADPDDDLSAEVDPGKLAADTGIPVVEVYARQPGLSPGSLLVPLVGGPASTVALRTGAILAERTGAKLELLHVVDYHSTQEQMAAWEARLASHLAFFGEDVDASIRVERAEHVADGVLERAAEHDVVVLGATRKGWLTRALRGTVPATVSEDAPVDTLVVHVG